jgi:hypothetical protein
MFRNAVVLAAALVAAPVLAGLDHRPVVADLVAERLRADFSGPEVVAAIRAQNAAHATLGQAEIDALDQSWRAEVKQGGGEMTGRVLGNPLSAMLKQKVAAYGGLITEAFVMDDKGLNVGQADLTSDYWQGDEDKYARTYGVGPDAVFVDEVEFDESSQTLQTQVSFTIVDPADGTAVGAITIGVNVDALGL